MVAKNPLLQAPPYQVEQALKRLGENLRLARNRRKLTIEEAVMRRQFGEAYARYAERVPALVPFVI